MYASVRVGLSLTSTDKSYTYALPADYDVAHLFGELGDFNHVTRKFPPIENIWVTAFYNAAASDIAFFRIFVRLFKRPPLCFPARNWGNSLL